jgi:SSS family solute:Na+ symporter
MVLSLMMIVISLINNGKLKDPKALDLEDDLFKTSSSFKLGALLIMGILTAIYTMWW